MSERKPVWTHLDTVIADLEEVEEYFKSRADAEYFTDRPDPVPNEGMRMLAYVQAALSQLMAP